MAPDRQTIVLCFDDSAGSAHAVRAAGRLFPGARAIVLHVWRPLEATAAYRYSAAGVTGALEDAMRELDSAGQEAAEVIAQRGAELARQAGFDAEPLALQVRDDMPPAVHEVAERAGAAAVVMGSRGLGAIRSTVLGGFSSPVLHQASRPVLIVPAHGDQ